MAKLLEIIKQSPTIQVEFSTHELNIIVHAVRKACVPDATPATIKLEEDLRDYYEKLMETATWNT